MIVPIEIIEEIFGYMDVDSIYNFSLTSYLTNNIVKKNEKHYIVPLIKRYVFNKYFNGDPEERSIYIKCNNSSCCAESHFSVKIQGVLTGFSKTSGVHKSRAFRDIHFFAMSSSRCAGKGNTFNIDITNLITLYRLDKLSYIYCQPSKFIIKKCNENFKMYLDNMQDCRERTIVAHLLLLVNRYLQTKI